MEAPLPGLLMPIKLEFNRLLDDMSQGEPNPAHQTPVNVVIVNDAIYVKFPAGGHDVGSAREVWIEMQAGSVMVRCYHPEKDDPLTVQIDTKWAGVVD